MPGNTDIWFVRSVSFVEGIYISVQHYFDCLCFLHFQVNIPAISISPFINNPNREHENDEFLFAEQYLRGIDVCKAILMRVANIM